MKRFPLLLISMGLMVSGQMAFADPAVEKLYIREIQNNNKDIIVLRQRDKQLYRMRMSVGCAAALPFDDQGRRGTFEGDGTLVYSGSNPFYSMGGGTLSVIHPMLRIQSKQANTDPIMCQILRIDRFSNEFNEIRSQETEE